MNARVNILRAARFEKPDRIPASFGISSGCWDHYPQAALQDLMADHPLLFPGFERSDEEVRPEYAPFRRAEAPYVDSWGCIWKTKVNGITGAVVEHPLADWAAFASFVGPSPEKHDGWGPIDWDDTRRGISAAIEEGRLASGGLRHGHTFLTLSYMRGYENLILDMMDTEPELSRLISMVEEFNLGLVHRFVEAGVEWMGYPEDLGMQQGPMLGPEQFRHYIKPIYRRLMAPAQDAGCVIHMHSDGDVRELCEDLVQIGVDVLNLQDLVNGIDWIATHLKGRVCIDLDIDRQRITRFGTPEEIGDHIGGAVDKLGSRSGGLMLTYGLYPGVPLENIEAVMDAMEKHSQHFV